MRIIPAVAALTGLSALAMASPVHVAGQRSSFEVEFEGGATWQSRNDAEVPNDGTATRFSLVDVAGSGPWPAGRLYLTWHLNDRHGLRLLLAPFSLTETGTLEDAVRFAGADYVAGAPTEATYTFNSYRLAYRWRFHVGRRATAFLGLTAKVRDATIGLQQGSTTSQKDDLGFVPLLHLAADWRISPGWQLSLDSDALAGGPGRAIDAALKLGYESENGWSVRAGYRTVEGGADVESVYAFAWLHSAVVSVGWRP